MNLKHNTVLAVIQGQPKKDLNKLSQCRHEEKE